jgi:hypothetical protein
MTPRVKTFGRFFSTFLQCKKHTAHVAPNH